nr:alpha/beta hydrolases superfamily protein [Tanacetum cinerariifolium]
MKDLSLLALDELIGNLKVHEVVMKKDSEIYKGKKERVNSIALKSKKESSDDETLTSGTNDEEYAIGVRNFKKFFRRKGKFVRQPREEKKPFRQRDEKKGKRDHKCFRFDDPNNLIGDCPKPPRNKDQRAYIRGQGFDSIKASTSGTKPMSFVGSSANATDGSTIKVDGSTIPRSVNPSGELNFSFGLQIKQMEDKIFFNQSKYIKEMLKKFGLEDSKPTKTPMSTEIKLTKDDEADSVDSTNIEAYLPRIQCSRQMDEDLKESYRCLEGHLFHKGRLVTPYFIEENNMLPSFQAVGLEPFLTLNEPICPRFVANSIILLKSKEMRRNVLTLSSNLVNPLSNILRNPTKEMGKRVASPLASFSSSSSFDDNQTPSFLESYKELPDDEDLTNAPREKKGMSKCLNRYFGTITNEEHPNVKTPSQPTQKKSLSLPQAPTKSISSKSTHYTSSSSLSESPTPTHVAPPPKLRFVIPLKLKPQELLPLTLNMDNWPSGPSNLSPPPCVLQSPPGFPHLPLRFEPLPSTQPLFDNINNNIPHLHNNAPSLENIHHPSPDLRN